MELKYDGVLNEWDVIKMSSRELLCSPMLDMTYVFYNPRERLHIETRVVGIYQYEQSVLLRIIEVVKNVEHNCEMYGYNPTWKQRFNNSNICGFLGEYRPCQLEISSKPHDKRICGLYKMHTKRYGEVQW